MKKKIIIILFIIITIIEAISPTIYAFTETREIIISEPAKIERQKAIDADIAAGMFLEPAIKLFTFVIDIAMSLFTSMMRQIDLEGVMVSDVDDVPNYEGIATTTFTISKSDMDSYKNALGILNIKYPNFKYSVENIFAGEIDLLSIDFISGKNSSGEANTDNGWKSIRIVISEWYKVIRMITIIGLLSVLIYTGIKIILSSTAQDKAKYKGLILNWLVAVVLAFTMHYIMAFILNVINELMKLLSGVAGVIEVNAGGTVFKTNLMGLARFELQQQQLSAQVTYLVVYTALVTYTFKFTFIYLKRVLKMAFLTIISPIVALTYPIDKMDGEAKGFQMWLKEYTYNVLLQPLHYILYYILVSSSLSLAAENPIYAIAALMFLSQGERLLKKIFGFDKAKQGTVGGIAGAYATGAVAASLTNFVRNPLHPFRKGNGRKRVGKGHEESENNILYNPKPTLEPGMDEFDKDFGETGGRGFGLPPLEGSSRGISTSIDDDENDNKTDAQKMFEADEKNGEFNDDPAYRDAMAREAYEPDFKGIYDRMSDDEYREYLRDKMGMDDETIEMAMAVRNGERQEKLDKQALDKYRSQGFGQNAYGHYYNPYIDDYDENYDPTKDKAFAQAPQPVPRPFPVSAPRPVPSPTPVPQTKPESFPTPSKDTRSVSTTPIRRMARGFGAVGKRLAKPVWDFDHNGKEGAWYNTKRLVRNVAKIGLGTGVGIAAAAVQAGISITDGKYSAKEGILTFGAGFAGGVQIEKGIESLGNTFMDGVTEGGTAEERKEAQMKRAQARYADREDVIAFNKKEYPGQENKMARRQRDHYLPRGVTALGEMKECINYADSLVQTYGITEEEADKRATATLDFRKKLQANGQLEAVYNSKKRDKYIKLMVDKEVSAGQDEETSRRRYLNAFNAVLAFNEANR